MKIGHTIDEQGYYKGDVLESSGIEPDVTVLCPDGLFRPLWNGSAWVEGLSQAEIDAIRNKPIAPSIEAQLKQLQQVVNDLIFGGM